MAVRPRDRSRTEPLESGLVFIGNSGVQVAELEFRQLEYFLAVAEELHFGRAAARLYITQPALSQAIAGLERTLDVQLFTRTRRSVELTDAGTELVRHARGLLADREAAVAGVRRVASGAAGVLHIGVAILAEDEIAPAFGAFASEHPELLLDRSTAVSERLLASLQSRDLHAAIVHQVPALDNVEGVEWEVIRIGRLAALMSESNDLADQPSVQLSDLADETFLVPPRELAPSAVSGMQTMCRTYGDFEPDVLELSTLGADWQPVINGDGIVLMAEGAARTVRPAATVAVPVESPPPFLLAMAWRGGNGAPILQRFLDFMRAYRDEHDWVSDLAQAGSARL